MTQEESNQIITEARQWIDQISSKEKQVQDLLAYSVRLFSECNTLFNETNEMLNPPPVLKRYARLPGVENKPTKEELDIAQNKTLNLLKFVTPLLDDLTAYRRRFEFYFKHRDECVVELNNNIANAGAKPKWAKLLKPAEKLPAFDKQVDKFLPPLADYQSKLDQVQLELNEIKERKK